MNQTLTLKRFMKGCNRMLTQNQGHRWFEKDLCVWCGKPPKKRTMEHIEPLVNGGSSGVGNMTVACYRCNSERQAWPIIYNLIRLRGGLHYQQGEIL